MFTHSHGAKPADKPQCIPGPQANCSKCGKFAYIIDANRCCLMCAVDAVNKDEPLTENDKPTVAASDPQYRMLKVGEVIREGDEMLDKETKGWLFTKYFVGHTTMYPNTVRRRIIPTDKAGQESAGGGETWWQKDLAKQDKEINDLRQRLDRSDKWTGEVIRRLCTAAGVAPEALDEASIEDLEQEIKDLIAYEVDQYKKCDRRNKDLTARLEKCDHHPWSYDQVCKDLDGMRQSKKELYETIAELEAEVAKVTAERDAMKADWHMDAYIKHMDSAQKEIATLKESLKIAEERNGKLLAFHELFGVKYGRQVKYEDALNEEQRIAWLAARQEKS